MKIAILGAGYVGLNTAAREVAAALSPDCMPTLVVKSTVPIGTGRSLRVLPRSTLAQDGACLHPSGSGSGACALRGRVMSMYPGDGRQITGTGSRTGTAK